MFSEVTFESNVPFGLRFMIDQNMSGMQWISIGPEQYVVRSDYEKVSTCQIEIDILDYRNINVVPLKQNSKIAPLRILSFDIEVSTDGIKFPTPNKDGVIAIANIVKVQGQSEPFVRNVFTLKSCA